MSTVVPDVPTDDIDPFDPAVLVDPYPFLRRLRDAGPVVHLPRYDLYAMGRYAEVHAALRNWQGFQSAAGVGLSNFRTETPWRPPSLLLEADPPHHDAPRAVLERILSPRALRRLQPTMQAAADRLVDDLLDGPAEIDAVRDIADVYPLRVFPNAVGIPAEHRELLLPYGNHAFNAFGPDNELVRANAHRVPELSGYIASCCAREALADGGFGAAIWAAADDGDILPAQAPLIVRSLLTAGVDTTVHAISAVLRCLASAPDQWRALRADPSRARIAFDEAIRLESPVQTFFRTALGDVRIGDVVVPDGKKILMYLSSANRDERRWPDPDRFDLDRDPSGHVGFGMGIHQCVGQHVARLEVVSLLTALARRVERIELAGDPTYAPNNTLHGLASVPVRLVPADAHPWT